MRQSRVKRSERAVLRGLDFIYRTACDVEAFADYGYDYLFSFWWISSTSQHPTLRALARRMGREHARRWRRDHSALPPDSDADTITSFVFASLSADGLGIRDLSLKSDIGDLAGRFNAYDYFWFEAAKEPPPSDVPLDCNCGSPNPRGSRCCRACGGPLATMSRYEVWVVALIRSYLGERYGVTLGARYREVIKWLARMRPYPGPDCDNADDFIWSIYAVTHVVYTLNDYSSYRLSPDWLPDEFEFLKNSVSEAISMDDPETVGEILDSLKSFGLGSRNALVREGMDYLVSKQNAEGSWGDPDAEDIYDRYHPTLTAINGLREYAWRGTRLSFPELKALLRPEKTQRL